MVLSRRGNPSEFIVVTLLGLLRWFRVARNDEVLIKVAETNTPSLRVSNGFIKVWQSI